MRAHDRPNRIVQSLRVSLSVQVHLAQRIEHRRRPFRTCLECHDTGAKVLVLLGLLVYQALERGNSLALHGDGAFKGQDSVVRVREHAALLLD
jgi:hypothetical protein